MWEQTEFEFIQTFPPFEFLENIISMITFGEHKLMQIRRKKSATGTSVIWINEVLLRDHSRVFIDSVFDLIFVCMSHQSVGENNVNLVGYISL